MKKQAVHISSWKLTVSPMKIILWWYVVPFLRTSTERKTQQTWRTSQWYQAAPNRFTFGVCLDAHHLKSKNELERMRRQLPPLALEVWGGRQSPTTWMVTVQAIWMQFAHGWCEYGMQSSCRVHMCWTRQLSFLLCWGGGICTDTMHCGRASGNWA